MIVINGYIALMAGLLALFGLSELVNPSDDTANADAEDNAVEDQDDNANDEDNAEDPDEEMPEDPEDEMEDEEEEPDPIDVDPDQEEVDIDFANGAQIIEGFEAGEDILNLTVDPTTRLEAGNSPADGSAFFSERGVNIVELNGVEDLPTEDVNVILRGDAMTGVDAQRFELQVVSEDSDAVLLEDPEASVYVIGSAGADDVQVSQGLAVVSLNEGDDNFASTVPAPLAGETQAQPLTISGTDPETGGPVVMADLNSVQRVFGGEGNDTLASGDAGGFLFGDEGNDSLLAGDGPVIIEGGTGEDDIIGSNAQREGETDVWLVGQEGDDLILGGAANEVIWGDDYDPSATAGNDLINAGGGDDVIFAGLGTDVVLGGTGDDVIHADQFDELAGGSGADSFIVSHDTNSPAAVTITDFEAGIDQLEITLDAVNSDADVEEVEFELVEVDNSTQVRAEGRLVAILEGVTDLDPSNITVSAATVEDEAA